MSEHSLYPSCSRTSLRSIYYQRQRVHQLTVGTTTSAVGAGGWVGGTAVGGMGVGGGASVAACVGMIATLSVSTITSGVAVVQAEPQWAVQVVVSLGQHMLSKQLQGKE